MKKIILFLIMAITVNSTLIFTRLYANQSVKLNLKNEVLNEKLDEAYQIITSQDVQLLVQTVKLDHYESQYFLGFHRDGWLAIIMFALASYTNNYIGREMQR